MKSMKNERGSVLVFATLMIVLLLVMVGVGLDTGWITYVRGLGQPAVDAAALAGASALPTGDPTIVYSRVAAYNTTNDYVNSKSATAQIQKDGTNVTLISWNPTSGSINPVGGIIYANGVRVALEQTNPYTGSNPQTAINAPLFLTPLFNVLGISMAKTTNINVSAVAVVQKIPGMPIVLAGCPPPGMCESQGADGIWKKCKLPQSTSKTDHSGWTTYTNHTPGANDVKAMVDEPANCKGAIPAVAIGDNICLNNGQTDSVLKEIFDVYSSNPYGLSTKDVEPFQEDCGLIPVVDVSTSFTGCDNPIKSWAKLCIRDVDSSGSPKYVYGDITCNQSPYGIPDTNAKACYTTRLVREKKSATCPTCAM